ncbi:hypothetical protein BKH45_04505 [Helicobacter sp. 11S03491-1]|nr:hypothetical protein BKH45_04505 [Helicobacter sp. 11S03491-1]
MFIGGCTSYQKNLNTFDKLYYEKNQQKAYAFSKKFIKKNDLLWEIQNGVSAYMVGEYKESIATLNQAEATLNKNYEAGIFSSATSNIGATLINDNVKSYKGYIYEGVLINYYKALDSLLMGDNALARVEFNRANDRQRRAKEYYQKEIKKALEAQNEQDKQKDAKFLSGNKTQSQVDNILNTKYSNLKNFQAYDGFVNPLVSYVSGLYFSLEGDSKGIDLLKQAYGINHSKFVGEDIILFQDHQVDQNKYTWVIIEDGKAAFKEEFSLELPLVLNDKVYYFGIALPQIIEGVDFYHTFNLKSPSKITDFEEISLFDGVITNEFSKQLPYILTRSIISTAYKTFMQILLNENLGTIAGIMGAIFSVATTAADTRITTVFPHKIWLSRMQNHENEDKITLQADGKNIFEFEFANCPNASAKSDITQPNKIKNKTQSDKICKNTNNLIYLRTTKNNIIYKLLIGEKQ